MLKALMKAIKQGLREAMKQGDEASNAHRVNKIEETRLTYDCDLNKIRASPPTRKTIAATVRDAERQLGTRIWHHTATAVEPRVGEAFMSLEPKSHLTKTCPCAECKDYPETGTSDSWTPCTGEGVSSK